MSTDIEAAAIVEESPRVNRRLVVGVTLALIIGLGAFLRFYRLGANSIGNAYYAATVQSMLTSWHNFFFAAFEPGGSVTVDKPPVGFWLQAASAYLFGVNGFALALPQALSGVLSIPLLYALVKRPFGSGAGLVAALALAVTPIAVATDRNNTIDGLLLFVLLLATWAFLRAVRGGSLGYLLLGASLLGIGFNIKMLQAFMSLPALYALYLLGARQAWWKRFAYLALATAVLVAISLSWAIAVDLTPPDERPYIGSSHNNTVMELIFGHNGLSRVRLAGNTGPQPAANGEVPLPPGPRGNLPPLPGGIQGPPPNAGPPPVNAPLPPKTDGQPGNNPLPPKTDGQPGNNPLPPGPIGPSEMGRPGLLRLFTEPLSDEASWLLPLALLGLPLLAVILGWKWPLTDRHLALVLWAGWLLPELVYFSFNAGLSHTYYLIMLGPPLAALAGATAWALGQALQRWTILTWVLVVLLVGGTLSFQLFVLKNYGDYSVLVEAFAIPFLALGLGLMVVAGAHQAGMGRVALATAVLVLLIAPLLWSGATTLNPNADVWLPHAGPDSIDRNRPTELSGSQEKLLAYLLANANPDGYLVVTANANQAAPFILATKRPVLTLGGFSGSDNIVDVRRLAYMVDSSQVRFVFDQGLEQQKPGISEWVKRSCTPVAVPGVTPPSPTTGPGIGGTLYDCGAR